VSQKTKFQYFSKSQPNNFLGTSSYILQLKNEVAIKAYILILKAVFLFDSVLKPQKISSESLNRKRWFFFFSPFHFSIHPCYFARFCASVLLFRRYILLIYVKLYILFKPDCAFPEN